MRNSKKLYRAGDGDHQTETVVYLDTESDGDSTEPDNSSDSDYVEEKEVDTTAEKANPSGTTKVKSVKSKSKLPKAKALVSAFTRIEFFLV